MDRDEPLALTGRTLAPAPRGVSFDAAFPTLPGPVRSEVLARDALMRRVHGEAKKVQAFAALAKPGLSAESLARMYYGKGSRKGYGWKDIGAAACIDHRRCGGCGVAGCTWEREAKLTAEVVERWRALAGANDKQGCTEAWEKIIRDLAAGEVIVRGVTWQTLFMQSFPGLPLPDSCPWSTSTPPAGWSLRNFTRQLGSKAVFMTQKKGAAVAWLHTPDVRMDLSSLRFLEAVVFDDHRLDFEVRVWDERGRVQTVELWGLFAMDVATGAVIAFGLRPKLVRPDGSAMGLTMRDMQHLVAHILLRYGYPLDYKMQLIVENAAAAVSEPAEHLFLTRTGGQVVVRRTGVHFSDALLTGWGERWGAPRGKAWLESWFHILDIALGWVKGQKGSDYRVKPGDHDGRLALCRKLDAVITAHPEMADKLSSPFEWLGDAHPIIQAAITQCNLRTDHDMQRHELVHEWRYNAHDTHPKPTAPRKGLPVDIAEQVAWFQAQPREVRDMLCNSYGTTRRESPLEKMARLVQGTRFARISEDTFVDLWMESIAATYKGGDVLDVPVRMGREVKKLRFAGGGHAMALGQDVRVRLDSTRPAAGAWIVDAKDRFLGRMAYTADPRMLRDEDADLLKAALGAKNKAFAELTTAAHRRSLKLPARGQELAARVADLAALGTIAPPPAEEAAALPESSDFVRAMAAPREPVLSSAEAFLQEQADRAALDRVEAPLNDPQTSFEPVPFDNGF